MKEFVSFSTTDFLFVPVSQLSTRDLFYFLENLKIKQDIFVLNFSFCSILEQRALWFPYSRLSFGIVFKRMLILECLRCFTKSIVVSILDIWHISFRKMFEWMTCKMRIITFESRATYRECLLFKRLSWHGKSVRCYQTFYFSRRGLQLFLLGAMLIENSITWANWKDKVKIAVGNKNDCLLRKNLI